MGAGFLSLIPQLPDFAGGGMNYGIFRKMRDDYASQVRHLRRREYQDMVFSMKEAGLNPMLAVGATPGHSAGMMSGGVASGAPGGVGTAVAANKQANTAEETGKSERRLKDRQSEVEDLKRFLIAEQTNAARASAANTEAGTRNLDSLTEKYQMETAATAQEVVKRKQENVKGGQEAAIYEGTEGRILRRINAWSEAIQGTSKATGVR